MSDFGIPKRVKKRIPLLAWVLLVLLPLPAFAVPKILLLHSYHPGYVGTDRVQEGMVSVLGKEAPAAEPFVEHMFDCSALKRFGINPIRLSRAGMVRNDTEVALRKSNRELDVSMSLAAILGLLATGLTVVLFDRQQVIKDLNESRQLFRTVADSTYAWEMWCNLDGRIKYISPSCERITGYGPQQFLEDPQLLERLVHPGDRESYCEHCGINGEASLEFRIVSRDGRVRWVEHVCWAVYDDKGTYLGRRVSNRDVTERIIAEQARQESETKFQAMLQSIPDCVCILDSGLHIAWANDTTLQAFGEQILGARCHEFFHRRAAPCESCPCTVGSMFKGRLQSHSYEVDMTLVDGQKHSFACSATVATRGEAGIPTGVMIVARDVTEKKQAEQDIQRMVYYDALTALPNRTLLNDHLHLVLEQAEREQQMVAVLLLDLDNFKHVNDSLGHARGDLLLQEVARRLAAETRKCDTLARWSGDEFVLLLTGQKNKNFIMTGVERILERLREEPFELEGNEVSISASIGIALFPQDSASPDSLLQHADAAMYEAKKSGRNAYRFFSQSIHDRSVERHQMEGRLRRAFKKQEFFLVFQPQIDLIAGRMFGVEALVRWQDPQLGVVSPASFIPLAEETGLIRPLGEWILRTACTQAAAWQEQGHRPLRLAVNLSVQQFRQPDLLLVVEGILRETGLNPHLLELELTESVLMDNRESTLETLNALKALGVGFAIDDFGTGYSSLSYLKHLPIERLKIAQEFVPDVPADSDDTAIVEAILAMAEGLGKSVIAEGVETQEQMAFLYERGCREMQGYYFARPMGAKGIEDLLVRGEFSSLAVGPLAEIPAAKPALVRHFSPIS